MKPLLTAIFLLLPTLAFAAYVVHLKDPATA
jgi:hypothetical protein